MKRILVVRPDRRRCACHPADPFSPGLFSRCVHWRSRAEQNYGSTAGQPEAQCHHHRRSRCQRSRIGRFLEKAAEIRRHRFDTALLVFPTQRAAYHLFAAGIPRRIGVGFILYEILTFMGSIGSRTFIPLRHEADYALDFARKLRAKHLSLKPEIFLSPEENQ